MAYLIVPVFVIVSVISWHGAHDVSVVLLAIMVVMAPMLFYIAYSERFDAYWIAREAAKPAEVRIIENIYYACAIYDFYGCINCISYIWMTRWLLSTPRSECIQMRSAIFSPCLSHYASEYIERNMT